MHFAPRFHVILILVMVLGLVVTTQPVAPANTQPATSSSAVPNVTTQPVSAIDTQLATPSSTVGDTAKHHEPLYDKTSLILMVGFLILLNIITVTGICLTYFEGRDTGGAVEETRDTREILEKIELTDRLTFGRS